MKPTGALKVTSIRSNGETTSKVFPQPIAWNKIRAEIDRTVLRYKGQIVLTSVDGEQ